MTAVALPNSARAKWAGLQDAEDEAQSFVLASVRRIGELQKALHFNPQGDKAANLEFEISRLRARQGVQQSYHQARAAIKARVRHWLTGLGPSVVIEACKPLKVKLKAGETLVSAVERLREQIAALCAEQTKLKLASPTIAEIEAAAAEHVNILAERGKPRLMIEHGKFEMRFGTETFNPQPDTVCYIAWLDPDALLKRLKAQIDAMPKPALALNAQAKAQKLAMLKDSLTTLEYEEEAMIAESEVEGPALARRPDASPGAILGVIVSQRKAVTAAA